MPDIFGKPAYNTVRPITADQIQILWSLIGSTPGQAGGTFAVADANNFQVNYQQNVSRRYTLNSPQNVATIYPGRPQGTITIGKLVIDKAAVTTPELLSGIYGGFSVCDPPATISWSNVNNASNTGVCDTNMGSYSALGCWVTNYSFQADADSLVVLDNVTVEFLQLLYTTSSGVIPTA